MAPASTLFNMISPPTRLPQKLIFPAALVRKPSLWLFVVIGLIGLGLTSAALLTPKSRPQSAALAGPSVTYLPIIQRPDHFYFDTPIWSHSNAPQPHEVSLFRVAFSLPEGLENAELHLFADTRYLAWLDGNFLGRGPARFAQSQCEYDVLSAGTLPPGEHVLAVLVQWAPENRRSESIRPLLQGHLEGRLASAGQTVVLRTGTAWRALPSPAWRADAAPMNDWGLIGPTELLDLRLLPADWMQPAFVDAAWPGAVTVDPQRAGGGAAPLVTSIQYQPRSIAFTVSQPVSATVMEVGLLSPGFTVGELLPEMGASYHLPFRATALHLFTIETLSPVGTPASNLIQLDGSDLSWQAAGAARPDVYFASLPLLVGTHQLDFSSIPAQGLTFALATDQISEITVPFQQGIHAGRRLLLAEPVSQPGSVVVTDTATLSLRFDTLPAYVVLDLGHATHGRVAAQVRGPQGTVIDIGWDERLLSGTTRPLPFPGSLHYSWNQADSWVLDGTPRSLTTLDARSGRYVLIAVWGSDAQASGPVWLEDLQVLEEAYPLTQQGSFQSSNPLLDQIWQIGVTSVRLNMGDAYMDPWRERGQWWGDAYVDDQINQVAFGDAGLLRRGIFLMEDAFSNSPAPGCAPHNNGMKMLDYAMLWVHSLAEYHLRTGDSATLYETYPTLQAFLAHLAGLQNPQTGLIDLPKTHWSETAYIEPLAYHSRYGQSTAVNALYYATLQHAATIAGLVGDAPSQANYLLRAETLRTQINSLLYLPSEGRYVTNIYQGTAYTPGPQAQAWALAYGLPPAGEEDRVAAALLELLSDDPAAPNLDIYGYFWVLEGLGRSGNIDPALALIEQSYGRLIDLGATTWWENFTANTRYANALSHGWGSAPTWFLTTYVLGARQTGPQEWSLQPALAGISSASGSIPLLGSSLEVSWNVGECGAGGVRRARVEIDAPPGASGQVLIPQAFAPALILVDGQSAWSAASPQAPLFQLGEGAHTLEIEGICVPTP